MTDRKFVYTSIAITILVCVVSYFFLPRYLSQLFITDIKVLSEKEVSRGDTDSAIKPSHFVITVEGNALTVCINGEEQFRYTPQDIAKDSYSISFYYPCKSELSALQIDY